MENPRKSQSKLDDLGVPLFLGTPQLLPMVGKANHQLMCQEMIASLFGMMTSHSPIVGIRFHWWSLAAITSHSGETVFKQLLFRCVFVCFPSSGRDESWGLPWHIQVSMILGASPFRYLTIETHHRLKMGKSTHRPWAMFSDAFCMFTRGYTSGKKNNIQ